MLVFKKKSLRLISILINKIFIKMNMLSFINLFITSINNSFLFNYTKIHFNSKFELLTFNKCCKLQKLFKVKKLDTNRLIAITLTVIPLLLCVLTILFPDSALAAKDDSLKDHTGKIEEFLTGNLMRMAVLGGTVWGAVQSYMSGKFIVLASTLGIGLGTYAILEWAKTTWAYVI